MASLNDYSIHRERERRTRRREDHRIMMSTRMRKIVEDALGISHDETDTDSSEEADDDLNAGDDDDDDDVEGKLECLVWNGMTDESGLG